MLSASTARELLLYMLWADRLVLAAVRPVREEDLTRDAGVSFKSILGTLAHILGAERMWLSRFLGVSLDRLPSIQDFPDPVSHMVNQATHHRGQVVSLLRQMGYAVPSTDLIVYFYERAAG